MVEKEIKKLIIDRKIWLRGENSYNSYLLRGSDNKRCCLGIYAQSLGIADCKIKNESSLNNLTYDEDKYLNNFHEDIEWLLSVNHNGNHVDSDLAYMLMEINDDTYTDDATKEIEIKKIFRDYANIEVEFIN